MNWEDLAAKKVPAPFKPVIRDELDVSNFAEEFTEMDPTYSPAALPQNCDRIFQVGGRGETSDSRTVFCGCLCFLRVIAQDELHALLLLPLLLCADVCPGFLLQAV